MKDFLIKFKTAIINFFKGIAIGISMIVPGVSGGTVALMLNIYEDIIEAVNNLFKHFGKSLRVLLPIGLGAIVGFLSLVIPLKYGLEKCPLIIITLFAGLIIGGIPSLYTKVHHHESVKGFGLTLISILFMVGTCFLVNLASFTTSDLLNNLNFGLWMYLFLAGIIISIALVMPGISGSMMLMVMGLYMSILTIFKGILKGENIGQSLLVMIPLALGVIIGFFVISFIMGKLLKKHEIGTYFVIIGLVIGSLVTIYILNFNLIVSTYDKVQVLLCVVFGLLGFIISCGFDCYFKSKQIEKEKLETPSNNEIKEEDKNDETR